MHRLGVSEQRLAARLLVRSLPELQDPDNLQPVRQALADSVVELRAAAKHTEWRAVQRELRLARDAGRTADVETLAARLNQLATERQRIRQGT